MLSVYSDCRKQIFVYELWAIERTKTGNLLTANLPYCDDGNNNKEFFYCHYHHHNKVSHDHLPFFIRLILSQNHAIWARASGSDWVKSALDVYSSTLYRLTICIRLDDAIRPNTYTEESGANRGSSRRPSPSFAREPARSRHVGSSRAVLAVFVLSDPMRAARNGPVHKDVLAD